MPITRRGHKYYIFVEKISGVLMMALPARYDDLFVSQLDPSMVVKWLSGGELSPVQYRILVSYYVMNKEWRQASYTVDRAYEDFPFYPEILTLYGDVLAAQYKWEDAEVEYRSKLSGYDMEPHLAARLAWSAMRQEKPVVAQRILRDFEQIPTNDLAACRALVSIHTQNELKELDFDWQPGPGHTDEIISHAIMEIALSNNNPEDVIKGTPWVWAPVMAWCPDKKLQALSAFFRALAEKRNIADTPIEVLAQYFPAAAIISAKTQTNSRKSLAALRKGLSWHPGNTELIEEFIRISPLDNTLLDHLESENIQPPVSVLEKLNDEAGSPVKDVSFFVDAQEKCKLRFTALGGAEKLGASSYVLEYAGKTVMLDCGLNPKRKGQRAYPEIDKWSGHVDAIVLSHGHLDHCGAVPKVHHLWPQASIYSTNCTKILANILFEDMLKLTRKNHVRETYVDTIIREDIEPVKRAMVTLEFGVWGEIFEGCRIRFHPAGHIAGASITEIEWEDMQILYTGDFCLHDQNLVKGAAVSKLPRNPDLLIIESTYAGREKAGDWHTQRVALREEISRILDGGGMVLLPSFAIGRSQELVIELSTMYMKGELPGGTLLFLSAGMTHDVYNQLSLTSEGGMLKSHYEWAGFRKLYPNDMPAPHSVTIASSGMMIANTPSAGIAAEMCLDKDASRHGILISGYLDEESEGQGGRVFRKSYFPGKYKVFSLSAHASSEALEQITSQINPRALCAVHWGSPRTTREECLETLRAATGNGCIAHAPLKGETIYPCDLFRWLRKKA